MREQIQALIIVGHQHNRLRLDCTAKVNFFGK